MAIIIARDEPALAKKAAQIVLETSADAVRKRRRVAWSLAGGKTPRNVYALLADSYYQSRIPWSNVLVFWGDERCVAPDHPDSNYKMAMDTFLSKVPIAPGNIHRIAGEMATPQEAAKAYEQDLLLTFRFDRPFPRFDLMFLGLGTDGHTASLFPETSALKERMKCVFGYRVEKLKENRVTLTFPIINSARRVVFLVAGEQKAGIVNEILRDDLPRDDVPLNRTPALGVAPNDGELLWLLDSAAASKLSAKIKLAAQNV
jgi:6-phosphogluconolactonase